MKNKLNFSSFEANESRQEASDSASGASDTEHDDILSRLFLSFSQEDHVFFVSKGCCSYNVYFSLFQPLIGISYRKKEEGMVGYCLLPSFTPHCLSSVLSLLSFFFIVHLHNSFFLFTSLRYHSFIAPVQYFLLLPL